MKLDKALEEANNKIKTLEQKLIDIVINLKDTETKN